jgi:hypothetical protein
MSYLDEHGLSEKKGLNHYTVACLLNKNYHLELGEDNEIFHALMLKIKFVLTSDKNSLLRSVLYGHWIFSYTDLTLMKPQKKYHSIDIPDIFALPPDYIKLSAELI